MRHTPPPDRPTGTGLLSVLRAHADQRARILFVVASGAAAALCEAAALVLIVPLTEAVSLDSGIGGRLGDLLDGPSPAQVLILGLALTAASVVLRITSAFGQVRIVRRIENQQKRRTYAAYLVAQPRAQQAARTGHLAEILNRANGFAELLGQTINALKALTSVVVFVVGAVLVQPSGALVVLAAGVLFFFLFRPLITRSRAASREATRAQLPITEHVTETQGARTEIRTFAAEGWAQSHFDTLVDRLTRARVKQAFLSGALPPLYQGTALIGIFLVLAVARSGDSFDLASLGAVAILLIRSLSYGQAFQSAYQRVQEMSAVTDLFQEAVGALEDERGTWGDAQLDVVDTVTFSSVTFTYDDDPAVDSVDLTFRAGDRIGIVGPSGAGKSTLVQLLLRLLRADAGTIRINGEPVDSYDPSSWARQVAIVPQHPVLLHGSVLENIAVFRQDLARTDLVTAAKSAALDAVITDLSKGYDTQIGPSSRALSGGQVQRLGLARALAGNPSLLILDEPTSALDVETEATVRRSLAELPPEVIVVVIAHRMSTLAFCNRIVVMEDGRVVGDGSPEEVALDSRYFNEVRDVD